MDRIAFPTELQFLFMAVFALCIIALCAIIVAINSDKWRDTGTKLYALNSSLGACAHQLKRIADAMEPPPELMATMTGQGAVATVATVTAAAAGADLKRGQAVRMVDGAAVPAEESSLDEFSASLEGGPAKNVSDTPTAMAANLGGLATPTGAEAVAVKLAREIRRKQRQEG